MAGVLGGSYFLRAYVQLAADSLVRSFSSYTFIFSGAGLSFPCVLALKDLEAGPFFFAKRVNVQFDPLAFFKGQVQITSVLIEDPVLFLEGDGDPLTGLWDPGTGPVSSGKVSVPSEYKKGGVRFPEVLKKFRIKDGELRIKDRNTGQTRVVSGIQAVFWDFPVRNSGVRTRFIMKAACRGMAVPFLGRWVKFTGWFDWANRDMDAVLIAWEGRGLPGLKARLESRANDLKVRGSVRLAGDARKPSAAHQSGVVENVLSGLMQAMSADIQAGFYFRTAMDHFRPGRILLKGNLVTGLDLQHPDRSILKDLKGVAEELLQGAGQ